jgi:pimeloyl-ACP methyl ester carboxylesterase
VAAGDSVDPGISAFRAAAGQGGDLWPIWDAISCPTLVLRGAESDLLAAATAATMRTRGPRPTVVEIPGVGHAPMLLSEDRWRRSSHSWIRSETPFSGGG